MTLFEYISVAQALLFSFVVGRLLSGVPAAIQKERAYWIHLCWIAQSFVAVAVTWWGIWGARDAEWTPFRFVWALLIPSLMFVRAAILVGSDSDAVMSFREHFYANRARFFTLSILVTLTAGLSPLVNGAPSPAVSRLLPISAIPLTVNFVGLLFSGPRVHGVLAIVSLAATASALFLLPAGAPPG